MPRCLEPDHHADFRALLSGETPAAANDSSQQTAKDHFSITVYYTSIDKVVSELQSRFEGNDQEVLCALGEIVFSRCYSLSEASTTSKLDQISMTWIVKCYQVRSQSLKTTTAGTHARKETQP